MSERHHPWRTLLAPLPNWHVEFCRLPAGVKGLTDIETKTIWISNRLNQAERRSTIAHEARHVALGHAECDPETDAQVEQEASRALIPLSELLRVLPWARNTTEAAEELWVDTDLLRARLNHLHPSERAAIKRAFAARDDCEE